MNEELVLWEISTTYNGKICAVVSSKKIYDGNEDVRYVTLLDIETGDILSELKTHFDFGAKRLTLSNNSKFCAVGAYQKFGIEMFDVTKNKMLWNNRDVKSLQFLAFSNHNEGSIYAGCDSGGCLRVDISNGKELEKIRGILRIYESPFEDMQLRIKRKQMVLFNAKNQSQKAVIKKLTFSELDAVFTKEYIVISEAAGCVSAYNMAGSMIWQYHPEKGSHILSLGYNEKTQEIVGCESPYKKNNGTSNICYLDKDNGKVNKRIQYENFSWSQSFAMKGTRLITGVGDMIDTNTGEIIKKFIV